MTDKEKFCLDGWIINKDADLAYRLSRDKPITATDENVHRLALRWLRSKPVKDYISKANAALIKNAEGRSKNRSKRDIIEELNTLADATTDIKQKAEILMKVADLQKMKDDRIEKDDPDLIHYFIPISCFDCSLYLREKMKKGYSSSTL